MAVEGEAPDADVEAEETVRVVEFQLGSSRYAIEVGQVSSIVEYEPPTRVPRASDAIEGVMDLRGEITAIVDPRFHFDVDSEPGDGVDQEVLVLDQTVDEQQVGLRVDAVFQVEEYPESRVDERADLDELDTPAVQRDLIRGLIKRSDPDTDEDSFQPISWIDVNRLVEDSRQ